MILFDFHSWVIVGCFCEESVACGVVEAFEEKKVDLWVVVFRVDESLEWVFMEAVGKPAAAVFYVFSLQEGIVSFVFGHRLEDVF